MCFLTFSFRQIILFNNEFIYNNLLGYLAPYLTWKEFDRDLANDLSLFITGKLYSRTVLTLPERQMVACAMLAALRATDELKLHVNAALNVGCDPRKITEIFFQLATYAGMPAVNEALQVYRDVLKERGEWPIK